MKLGIIGCGKMGTALVGGAVRSGVLAPAEIAGFDPFPEALESFARATGACAAESLAALVADSERLLLCVRPQDVPEVLEGVGRATVDPVPLISIAAGITTGTLERGLPAGSRVIRVMPNTPALVDKGAAAYCAGTHATEEDIAFASRLLESVGLAMKVDESLMDTVTGLSGSGPAFVFLMIEALADGGVNCGLTRAQALRLSAQTVLGAAAMVLETGEHPAILRDKVASPGGTTIAGLAELERRGLRAALIYAVDVAARKSKKLGKS
jgi:pyrroline-5-carboxylate reductase